MGKIIKLKEHPKYEERLALPSYEDCELVHKQKNDEVHCGYFPDCGTCSVLKSNKKLKPILTKYLITQKFE